jgi:hypothetical protein
MKTEGRKEGRKRFWIPRSNPNLQSCKKRVVWKDCEHKGDEKEEHPNVAELQGRIVSTKNMRRRNI